MRIGLSAIGGRAGGPRTFARSLVAGLRGISDPPEIRVFGDRPEALGATASEAVHVPGLGSPLRPLLEATRLPSLARREGIDVFHGTKHSLPPGLPCPSVVSVHDLAPFRDPASFSRAAGHYLRRSTAAAVRRAGAVAVGSEATRRDLLEVLGVDAERIRVISYGVEERFRRRPSPDLLGEARRRIGLAPPLVLCVGTIQPRKGQERVLEAFASLRGRLRPPPSLLFVGRRGWLSRPFEQALARWGGPDVRWIQDLPDDLLPAVFGCAEIFVSASRIEGFGLAIAEAMAAGLPVVALEDGSVPEVVGGAGRLLARPDPDLLAEAIRGLLEDEGERRRLGAAAALRAGEFRWERTAERFLDLYLALARPSGALATGS